MEFLSKDIGMHRSVTYFADALCYTPKHFSKVIKQACGRAPLDLINETAIEHIKNRQKQSDKSIKEIAEELGVSKTAVRKQIANLGLQTSLRKIGNQFAIEKEQETLIKSAFSQKQSQTKIANQVSDFANQSETSLRLVSMLQHELEIKNRELEIKNKQIEELNARLAEVTSALTTAQQTAQAAQALHAGMIQQQLKSGEAASAEPETPDKGKRKRWWKW